MDAHDPLLAMDADVGSGRFETLARILETLASEPRLELLHALRTPQIASEIRVAPGLTREGERPDRSLSRQAISRHLEQLLDAGLLQRTRAGPTRGEKYVLNHERLFAMVDELRSLAKLRPVASEPMLPGATILQGADTSVKLPPPPRLLVAYGRDDGVSFSLGAPEGSRWRIGRAPACEIHLDYDPYLSSEHSILERTSTGFIIRDNGARNGTWVNWQQLPRLGVYSLRSGDLLTLGRSVLVFQDALRR